MISIQSKFILGLLAAMSFSGSSWAATQAGSNPFVFDQKAERDNLISLMAAASEHNDQLTVRSARPKHYFVTNFDDSNDYLVWNVSLEKGAKYRVWALLDSAEAVPVTLSVDGTAISIGVDTKTIGWDRLEMGTIDIPSGTSQLRFQRTGSSTSTMQIKSLELIRESDLPAYEQRVKDFKADLTPFSQSVYGLMFQYGAWGYPQTGTERKSIDQGAADFDVDKFVKMVESTGAAYVIWSFSWWQYWVQAPIKAVDDIVGNSNLTAERDLIGEIAEALHNSENCIGFFLYYHQGIQQEPEWAAAQKFPSSFAGTGTGDRTVFFDNWKRVISEVGERYGTNLDGWFFDDGHAYYPAPYEALAEAARTGNPNRSISYNDTNGVLLTNFQDTTMGEQRHSEPSFGSPAAGSSGYYTEGPFEGMLQHSMYKADSGWGGNAPNQEVITKVGASAAIDWTTFSKEHNTPISFDLMMFEDGTVLESTVNSLIAAKEALGSDGPVRSACSLIKADPGTSGSGGSNGAGGTAGGASGTANSGASGSVDAGGVDGTSHVSSSGTEPSAASCACTLGTPMEKHGKALSLWGFGIALVLLALRRRQGT